MSIISGVIVICATLEYRKRIVNYQSIGLSRSRIRSWPSGCQVVNVSHDRHTAAADLQACDHRIGGKSHVGDLNPVPLTMGAPEKLSKLERLRHVPLFLVFRRTHVSVRVCHAYLYACVCVCMYVYMHPARLFCLHSYNTPIGTEQYRSSGIFPLPAPDHRRLFSPHVRDTCAPHNGRVEATIGANGWPRG